ncbi:hypothetical protein GCM10027615_48280 [Plantactinospora veratri]
MSQTVRAPAWVMKTGTRLASMTSSEVRSPECETSMAMPSLFIRSTARRPKWVSPPSRSSESPEPSMFAWLYAIPIWRTPKPYRMSIRSSSFSIIVAASSPATRASWPFRLAVKISSRVVATTT